MATHASTRSTTRAKVLTAVTVAAAGVAAYMAGSLSNDLLQNPLSSSSITRAEQRRSCLLTCEYNGGFPCGASIDTVAESACREAVRSCQLSCPAPDVKTSVLLMADGSVESLPVAQLGVSYHRVLVATPIETIPGGIWEVTKGALPPGMDLDPLSGTLFGVPTRADQYDFSLTRSVLTEKSAEAIRVTARLRFTVEDQRVPVATVGSTSTPDAALSPLDITTPIGQLSLVREEEFDVQLNVYGIPVAEQQWSIAYGRLPEGMVLSPRGRLYGKPTEKAGTYRFGVVATSPTHEAAGMRAYEDGTIQLRDAVASTPPVTPPVGSVAGDGEGVPSPETDVNTVMSPASLPVARVGEAYSVPLSVNDSYVRTWAVTGLPQGLSFNSDSRVIFGTPTVDGIFTLQVRARRVSGLMFEKTYALTVNRAGQTVAELLDAQRGGAPGIVIDINVPDAIAGRAYAAQLRAMSSYAVIHWSLSSPDPIPAGWSLSLSGVLTHANPRVGVVTLPVLARSSDGAAAERQNIVINVRPATVAEQETTGAGAGTSGSSGTGTSSATGATLAFSNVSSYPDGTVGVAYSARPFEVTGGQGAYSYSRSSGMLPPGLTMASNGAIQGTPTAVGSHSFTMRVTDGSGVVIQANRTIRINAAPASSNGSGQTVSSGGGGGGGVASVTVLPNSESAATQGRLNTLNRLGIQVHDLIKLQDDGDPNTQHDTTVYYIGSDGRRHFFPNPKVYFTWFHDFSQVRIVSAASLAEIPLGANVTYRPGVRMVKFDSDNKVYVVEGGRRLRWIQSESDASSIYGANWNRNIDDIPVVFYTDYVFGSTLGSAASYSPAITMAMITWPSQVLP